MDVLGEIDRARFDTEWSILNALRELSHIALRGDDPPTYRRVLHLAELLIPGIFSHEKRIIDKAPESIEAKGYREKALAETRRQGTQVTALELVEKDIKELQLQVYAVPEGTVIKSKLNTALLVRQEIKATRHSEGELIFRDAIATGINFDVSGSGQKYMEYKLDDNRALKISVFHPDFPEHKTGADLLYEIYNVKQETARVAAVQYKMWDKDSLHRTPGMGKQLEKLTQFACEKDFIKYKTLCYRDEVPKGRLYRLPYCAAFLRPTDRLQLPNSKMVSTGNHVPVCVVNDCWVKNQKGNLSLRKEHILDRSLSEIVFKELFVSGMVGSQEMSWRHLAELYRRIGIFSNDQVVLVHAQELMLGAG